MARIDSNWVPNATNLVDYPVRNGGSKPRVCDFDDRVLRLVKWHPSIHGHTATYSELIVSRIGQLFDAPVIRGAIVHVESGLLPGEIKRMTDHEFHVGFTYLRGENFNNGDYPIINNGFTGG